MTEFEKNARLTISLIKSAITDEKLDFDIDIESRFDEIMRFAASHEVAHLVAYSLIRGNHLTDEEQLKAAKKEIYNASYRDTKNRYTLEVASSVLEKAKIPYIALKGVVIKNCYPEKWMRSSCDIDVLVQKKDFDNAVDILKDNGFKLGGTLDFHDISLRYDDTNLELHFSVCENIKNIDAVLKKIWSYSEKKCGYEYEESRDFFVFHHIAHMSYHFLAGGCGIRPFLDLWILRRADFFNSDNVKSLCAAAKISEFYDGVQETLDVWFEGKEYSDLTRMIEKYIIVGGAYGSFFNNAAIYTIRKGGRAFNILSLAFPPYSNMKVLYPVLNRAPILLPLCYIYRLFQKTLGKNSERARKKYKVIKEQDSGFVKEVEKLIKTLKLDGKG